jgi:hypothetical protein
MKFQIRPPSGRGECSVVNQEIVRAKAVMDRSRLINKKAHELTHTATNLRTVSSFMREWNHWRRQENLTNDYLWSASTMLLRDHPLMSYQGIRSWPPTWTWLYGLEGKQPQGEIGILRAVSLSKLNRPISCYLYIHHEASAYLGCMLFDDTAFCRHIAEVLRFCCNRAVAEIGSLDLTYTL